MKDGKPRFSVWTDEQIALLREHYPSKGKQWCVERLGFTEGQIRWKASNLGIKARGVSEAYLKKCAEHAEILRGRKRPEQAEVMRRNHAEGKLMRSQESRDAQGRELSALWKERGHPRGMAGKSHTEETKRIISEKGKGRIVSRESIARGMMTRYRNGWSPPSVNRSWKAGKAEDLGDIHFRSAWERNYARYLNWLKGRGEVLGWEFEKDTFYFEGVKRGTVCYRPDFKVLMPSGDTEYHEVKGWMDPASITKIKRMAKYHPTVKLVVIDKKAYKSIAKNGALFSPHWEGQPKYKPRKKGV